MNKTEMKGMNTHHYYCLQMNNVARLHRKMIAYKLHHTLGSEKEFSIKCILVDTDLTDFYVNVDALVYIKIICIYHLSFKQCFL